MLRSALLSVCLLFSMTTLGPAQVRLERKVPEDATFTVETTAKVDQKLTIAGQEVDTASDTRSVSKVTTGKRNAEGTIRAQQKVESLTINMTVMGMNYTFDSANPDNKGGSPLELVRDIHKALARRATTIVYNKDNEVAAVESDEDIANSLPPEAKALASSQLDDDTLKNSINEELNQLTSEPIKKGDTWKRTGGANFGAGQVMTLEYEFTYEGPVQQDGRELDKITSKALSVKFALENSPLPLSLKSSDLKVAESENVIFFDREKGQTVSSSSLLRITGDITFAINDMELPSKLDLKIQGANVVK